MSKHKNQQARHAEKWDREKVRAWVDEVTPRPTPPPKNEGGTISPWSNPEVMTARRAMLGID